MQRNAWRSRQMQRLIPLSAILLACASGANTVGAQGIETAVKDLAHGTVLRVERGPGGHGRWSGSLDAQESYLAERGSDETIRVWHLATGRLVRTIHLPYSQKAQEEAKIEHHVALAPDASLLIADGVVQDGLYVIDPQTGTVLQHLPHVQHVADVAFSPDGTKVAVSVGNGLLMFTVQQQHLVQTASSSDKASYLFYTTAGLLTRYGNDVRQYGSDLTLMLTRRLPTIDSGGYLGVAPSHDGAIVAIGWWSNAEKLFIGKIFSWPNLKELYDIDLANMSLTANNFSWSRGDNYLALISYDRTAKKPILRTWSNAGRGPYRDVSAAGPEILLKNGDALFFDESGNWIWPHTTLSAAAQRWELAPSDSNLRQGLFVSHDGLTVETKGNGTLQRFRLAERLLETPSRPGANLVQARTSSAAIPINAWEGHTDLTYKGRDLGIHSQIMGIALAPDEAGFVTASSRLMHWDKEGRLLWVVPLSGWADAVNISGNGRLVIVTQGDGLISWYRLTDGVPVLSLFIHADTKRWVLWTPSGYYDCSPGGEDLIGWQVNRGVGQAADYYPASRFRARFYQPTVIAKIAETFDEAEALRLAKVKGAFDETSPDLEQALPPVVTILSPLHNTPVDEREVLVRFAVKLSAGEALLGFKVLVDGRPVAMQRDLIVTPKSGGTSTAGTDTVRELRVTVPEHDSEIAILASNRHGTSMPATVQIRWRNGGRARDEFVIQPKLYVLAIGISAYALGDLKLGFAAKDAKDFANMVARQKGGLYRDVALKVLTDRQATKDEILDGLEWLQKETTSKDVAMIFLAGHGVNDPTGVYYFLPADVDPGKLKRTGVAFSDIKNTISALAGKVLAFVDTCHSGNVMGTRRGVADITAVVNELVSAESGAIVFASSTGKQYSLEDQKWGNGAFTKALLEGFGGKAAYGGKGRVTLNMLDLYLSERVKELTGGRQTPTTTKPDTIPDFPIAFTK